MKSGDGIVWKAGLGLCGGVSCGREMGEGGYGGVVAAFSVALCMGGNFFGYGCNTAVALRPMATPSALAVSATTAGSSLAREPGTNRLM